MIQLLVRSFIYHLVSPPPFCCWQSLLLSGATEGRRKRLFKGMSRLFRCVNHIVQRASMLESLSKNVFERRTNINRKSGLLPFKYAFYRFQCELPSVLYSYKDGMSTLWGKTTAQDCKKSTPGWRASLKNGFS